MALKYTLENLEGVEENFHSLYREDNGKYVLDVEGVRSATDFDKVNNALVSERKLSKQYKDSATSWESKFAGRTPDQILADLERIPVLEAESVGKVDSKKMNEIAEITAKQRMAPLEHEITKLKQAAAEKDQTIAQFQAADRRRTIHDAVRALAAKEGFQEQTYAGAEGALMLLAERYLTINTIGEVVVAEGAKPYTEGLGLKEALGEIKQHHPYLLKPSVGGGSAGNTGGGSISGNPFRGNDMTARGRFINENPTTWEAAMKQAGLSSPHELHKNR
jgi:hypothetical protein